MMIQRAMLIARLNGEIIAYENEIRSLEKSIAERKEMLSKILNNEVTE